LDEIKRIGILQGTLNPQGGGERFAVDLITVLKDRGYEVHLATFDRVDWSRVEENMGSCVRPDKCVSVLWRRLPIFGIYQRLLIGFAANRLRKGVDLTINTMSDHRFSHCNLVYMHGLTAFAKLNLPWWKIPYVLPYRMLTWIGAKANAQGDSVFIANSNYTARQLLLEHDIKADYVIYPPVHTETYRPLASRRDRENTVLTISRYVREKNLHDIIEIAKKTRDEISFVVVGNAENRFEKAIANELITEAGCLNLPITFHINISQDEKHEIMSRTKVYLHLGRVETFGVAVCEAISAGCLPVAVNEGGHLEIIKALGPVGRVYRDFDEAAECVEAAVAGWSPALAELVSSQMEKFSYANFSDKIIRVIKQFET
jgi:glycosyltransferase involved in cell wall biosynthesis